MAKTTGAYKSLVRGVSEQVPQDRLEGQHWEQVNMISDPIRGLSRRRGSEWRGNQPIITGFDLTAITMEDMTSFKEFSFYFQGQEYCLGYRTKNYLGAADLQTSGVFCYNKDTGQFLDVEQTSQAADIMKAGVSSVTNVGRYILMASAYYKPSHDRQDMVEEFGNWAFAWVRGGDYSRTYSLTVQTSARTFSVSYTTMTSYYTGTLDTSDIPVLDAENKPRQTYQKEVNDRVNKYNAAVNQHLAAATTDIQPQNIAQKLLDATRAQNIPSSELDLGRSGATVAFNGATMLLADDGGNGQNLIATAREVESLDRLTRINKFGKTVRVTITDADPYYVTAYSKVDANDRGGWGEVIWKEGPGEKFTPNFMFLTATIRGGTLYIGAGPTDLEDSLNDGTEVPRYLPSSAGDGDSSPLPEIFERPINYLGIFQDRLVMVSGATVFMSRSGDYFNFFRKSVLNVDSDDPIEIYALGSEDDFIRSGAMIDRNFILFGDRQQYLINGREAITPQNAFIAVLSAHEGATDAAPASLGGLLFFTQYRGGRTSLMQMQTGSFSDTLDAFSVSQQLSTYLKGKPVQILTASNPQNVVVRTEGNQYGFYLYTFLDAPGQEQRYFDAWSRWQWDERLGPMVSMTMHDNNVVVFTLRKYGGGYMLVADEYSREADRNNMPHVDSRAVGLDKHVDVFPDYVDAYWSVLPGGHRRQYYGVPVEEREQLSQLSGVEPDDIHTGVPFHSYYEPTSPYRRDRDGIAILDGRLTLSSILLSVAHSGAFTVDMWMDSGTQEVRRILDLTNWRISDSRVKLGAVPVRDGQHRAFIGREIREHRLRIAAKLWLPLTITTVEWEGQVFSNRRR